MSIKSNQYIKGKQITSAEEFIDCLKHKKVYIDSPEWEGLFTYNFATPYLAKNYYNVRTKSEGDTTFYEAVLTNYKPVFSLQVDERLYDYINKISEYKYNENELEDIIKVIYKIINNL